LRRYLLSFSGFRGSGDPLSIRALVYAPILATKTPGTTRFKTTLRIVANIACCAWEMIQVTPALYLPMNAENIVIFTGFD
jgi:hypothetical protein